VKHYLTLEDLKQIPESIAQKALNILRAYGEVTIRYEYGEYSVMAGTIIKAQYGGDYKVVGYVRAVDVYTLEERTQNYIESFHDYPIWYKGKRDYKALKEKYGEPPQMD